MDVVRFLRKLGYSVTFPPNSVRTILVNGEVSQINFKSYWKLPAIRWNPHVGSKGGNDGRYIITKHIIPGSRRKDYMDIKWAFLIMQDKADLPVYQVDMSKVRRSIEISKNGTTHKPIHFIGNLRKKGRVKEDENIKHKRVRSI